MPLSVNLRGRTRLTLLATATALLVALPAAAAHAAKPQAGAAGTGITLEFTGKSKKVDLLKKVVLEGAVATPLPSDNVQVTVSASGRELWTKKLSPKADGSFQVPVEVNACCRYVVEAENARQEGDRLLQRRGAEEARQGRRHGAVQPLAPGAGLPHRAPRAPASPAAPTSRSRPSARPTAWAAASPTSPPSSATLLKGKGGFEPRYDDGSHVEVDISRQVMSLIEGDTPVHTFHVSTGSSATPTVRGNFRFYCKDAGYNAKRMYFSVYFIRRLRHPRLQPGPELPRHPTAASATRSSSAASSTTGSTSGCRFTSTAEVAQGRPALGCGVGSRGVELELKIFVAGATGAIGRPLLPLLVDAGHEVVGTTRSEAKAEQIRAAGGEPVVLDVLDSRGSARGRRRRRARGGDQPADGAAGRARLPRPGGACGDQPLRGRGRSLAGEDRRRRRRQAPDRAERRLLLRAHRRPGQVARTTR